MVKNEGESRQMTQSDGWREGQGTGWRARKTENRESYLREWEDRRMESFWGPPLVLISFTTFNVFRYLVFTAAKGRKKTYLYASQQRFNTISSPALGSCWPRVARLLNMQRDKKRKMSLWFSLQVCETTFVILNVFEDCFSSLSLFFPFFNLISHV